MKQEMQLDDIAGRMRAGDLVCFADRSWLSRGIRWVTRADAGHVGSVLQAVPGPARTVNLVEALWRVTVTDLGSRLAEYGARGGCAWWLPLAPEVRERFDEAAARDWAERQVGRRYGWLQALLSAFRLPMPESHWLAHCSELSAGMLERGGALPGINASHVTPGDLVRVAIWDDYRQLAGPPTGLSGFNCVPLPEWRRAVLTR
jgi:hypothetical protein